MKFPKFNPTPKNIAIALVAIVILIFGFYHLLRFSIITIYPTTFAEPKIATYCDERAAVWNHFSNAKQSLNCAISSSHPSIHNEHGQLDPYLDFFNIAITEGANCKKEGYSELYKNCINCQLSGRTFTNSPDFNTTGICK
jgi:hypothetical protein